jgi:hypothetical protein
MCLSSDGYHVQLRTHMFMFRKLNCNFWQVVATKYAFASTVDINNMRTAVVDPSVLLHMTVKSISALWFNFRSVLVYWGKYITIWKPFCY